MKMKFTGVFLFFDLNCIITSMEQYILKEHSDGSVTTVRDVQLVLLEMLKDIDAICRKHNIPYYLTGGSCLGAVRHQGFIPWDDDADIGMLYEDYLRFLVALKEDLDPEKYYFQCFASHKEYNVCIPAMKIRKRNTYIKEVNTLLANKCKDGDGLFIDVFLVDYMSENKAEDFMCRMKSYAYMASITALENLNINPFKLKRHFVKMSRDYSRKHQDSTLIGYDMNWTYNSPLKPVVYKKDDIYPVKYIKFEDTYLPVPKNPDALLEVEIGGEYMQYPKMKMQAPKHIIDINLNGEDH